VVTVRELDVSEVEDVDRQLPLNRLDQWREDASTYLIAWEGSRAVGHAHVAWERTHLGLPEIQDVFVPPEHRRQGIASELTRAAEGEAQKRGFDRISLSVTAEGNEPASRLYASLGYRDAGVPPVRVVGTIALRGEPFEVDDTLVYLVRSLTTDVAGR
jgi:ribosomal protein S18 acetylase RimI-like enzyme